MTWDYATGQEYVRIEGGLGDEVIALIVEIPLSCPDAEQIAAVICDMHNREIVKRRAS